MDKCALFFAYLTTIIVLQSQHLFYYINTNVLIDSCLEINIIFIVYVCQILGKCLEGAWSNHCIYGCGEYYRYCTLTNHESDYIVR